MIIHQFAWHHTLPVKENAFRHVKIFSDGVNMIGARLFSSMQVPPNADCTPDHCLKT
jgi:hypothetical protein